VKMTRFGWCLGVGLFLGCATASPPPQNATATATSTQSVQSDSSAKKDGAAVATKDDPNKLVCESETLTGTRIPKKICRSQRQIDAEREAAEKAVRDGNRNRPKFDN
jgi:hypothetical protein